MSPPAVTAETAPPKEDSAPVLKREASLSTTSAQPGGSAMLKIFLHEGTTKKPFGLIKFPRPAESLTLVQLRAIIQEQLDIPATTEAGCGSKRTASEAEMTDSTGWSDLKYHLLFDGMPVAQKQEALLRFPEDFATTSELGISLEEHPSKKPKLDEQEAAKAEAEAEEKKKEAELPFKVVREEIISCRTGEVVGHENVLTFDNDSENPEKAHITELCNLLRNLTHNATFYNKDAKMKEDLFFHHLQKLKASANSEANKQLLEPLIKYLEKKFEDTLRSIEKMLANNQITFTYLWYLFPKDSKFTASLQGELVGSSVEDTRYQHSFFGTTFQVSGLFIKSNGVGLSNFNKWFSVEEFEGLRDIKDLPIQPMTEEKLAKLSERGKMFREVSLGAHYLQYHGSMSVQQWFMTQKFKADGRIMVDPVSFNRFNPNYQGFRFNTDEEKGVDSISDEKLFMTWPSVVGFSFATKKWGEFLVSNLASVKFDQDAFDRLVLDEDRKRLIKCLVQNSSQAFSDIISGKGGGVIFLLHGPPGTGKTVSAESLSELLRRPLYSVNVGEIGVTTKQLEEKLSQILEMASTWNAIVLLDEADIFLERRTDNDIERNALVGIFLRLLEYHQGVMFLTTNRVKSFDEAFHSRISIALHYQALDRTARRKVWENLLDAAKVEGDLDPEELSGYELNGRQIKNVIRLAQTIAFEEKKPVSKADIAKCVEVARQFQQDLKS